MFKIAGWCSNMFAWMFILYGGIKMVLAILDHKYGEIAEPITILVLGLILIAPVIAFRDLRAWGYWGLVGINGIVLILSLIGIGDLLNLFPLALSAVALFALFNPATRLYLFGPA